MDKTIYIVGHSNPDIDSILSSMLMKDILKNKGINCECAVFENDALNQEYIDIANLYGTYEPKVIKNNDIQNHRYILVDHNDISTTIKNKNLISGIIDHHKNSGWEKRDNFVFTDRCSTTIAIYEFFKNEHQFTNEQKEQILIGLAFDSKFGKSRKYELIDELLAKELNLDKMPEDLLQTYFVPSDISDDKILMNDRKPIMIGNIKYESCSLMMNNQNAFGKLYKAIEKTNEKNFIGLISDINLETTSVIIKENGEIKHLKHFDELYSRKEMEKDFENFIENEQKIEKDEQLR